MKRVLIIEDDAAQRQMFRMILGSESTEFTVDVVDQFAGRAADWSQYGLVLVDVMMAIHDGISLVVEKKRSGGFVPMVIIMSALPDALLKQEFDRLSEQGLADNVCHMTKVGSLFDFRRRIERIMGSFREDTDYRA